jgi:hypothetical protein
VYRYVVLKLLEPFCQGIISAEPQGLAFIAKYTKLRVHPSQHTVAMLQCVVLKSQEHYLLYFGKKLCKEFLFHCFVYL